MSNAWQMAEQASLEFEELMREIDTARHRDLGDASVSLRPAITNPVEAWEPQELSGYIMDEIPKQDPTYQRLSTTLIPHPRLRNVQLLEYRTFAGVQAFQPCGSTIEKSGIFDSLDVLDRNGDQAFKTARTWSCVIQAKEVLPKEVRWVLATIYNLANEVLRPEYDEDDLWLMRHWLLHWYDVADELFEIFKIEATSPETQWFTRPTITQPQPPLNLARNTWGFYQVPHMSSLSPTGTVIRQHPVLQAVADIHQPLQAHIECVSPSAVDQWLDALPEILDEDPPVRSSEEVRDLPESFCQRRYQLRGQHSESTVMPALSPSKANIKLNPRAAPFSPRNCDAGESASSSRQSSFMLQSCHPNALESDGGLDEMSSATSVASLEASEMLKQMLTRMPRAIIQNFLQETATVDPGDFS